MDFYSEVPKDLERNLQYRIRLRERAQGDDYFQAALMEACRHDVLFFINAFCYLYEPRPMVVDGIKQPHVIPFVTRPNQDKAILSIIQKLGFEDIGVEKSRGEGASWIAIVLALKDFLFEPMSAIGFVSRNEAAVDSPDDPDTLFWKLDWSLLRFPEWMVPTGTVKRSVTEHTLKNLRNGSTIAGYAAVGDVASGGRKNWFLMDELAKFPRGADREAMASTQHVTNCRMAVSTPKGSEGAYYDLMHEPSSMLKVILDWKDNPTRNRGLYRFINGECVALDPVNNPLPPNYGELSKDMFSRLRLRGYKLEGVDRSPFYDHECDRAGATPQNIAQELDRDYGGSMYRIFGSSFFEKADATVAPPLIKGNVSYNEEKLEVEFEQAHEGQTLLWTQLDGKGRPPRHQYVVGCDVCSGLGGSYTSNSVLEVIDMNTMEQVLEFSSNTVEPKQFAEMSISVAKWFWDAYLIWEHNGPGAQFTQRVIDKQYQNYYLRTTLWKKGRTKQKVAGWWTGEESKEHMFGDFLNHVKMDRLRVRSKALVTECGQYVRLNGKIEHIASADNRRSDESSKGKAHGDRVVAMCVCLQGVKDRPLAYIQSKEDNDLNNPPPNTLAAREKEYLESLKQDVDGWARLAV